MDARVLPGNRVLIAESTGKAVRERDIATGKVLWEQKFDEEPVNCERLADGTTWIGTRRNSVVVKRDNTVVASHVVSADTINSIRRSPRGHVVAITIGNQLVHADAAGKLVRKVELPKGGNYGDAEILPSGNYLATDQTNGRIVELEPQGGCGPQDRRAGGVRPGPAAGRRVRDRDRQAGPARGRGRQDDVGDGVRRLRPPGAPALRLQRGVMSMPDFRPWVAGLLACATFCLPVRAAVDDATRTFAAAKCKYTLPGPDLEWQTPEQKERIFSAIHESGASITLTAGEVSEGFRLTEKSLANIVGFVEKNSDLKFLGRKRVTVAGVEGYQIDWKRNDGRRSSSRVVCANGRLYHLTGLLAP